MNSITEQPTQPLLQFDVVSKADTDQQSSEKIKTSTKKVTFEKDAN